MPSDMANAQKSWFSKPDGKVGTFLGFALVAVLGLGVLLNLNAILVWLIALATNMLTLAALCAALVAIGVVIFDPRWRNLLFYGYKSLMRGLTGLFIELDPIGILKTYISELRDKLEEMDKSIGNLRGQLGKLNKQIHENEAGAEHSMELVAEGTKQGRRDVVILNARQKERLEKSNLSLNELKARMEKLLAALQKMREGANMMVLDMQGEVDLKTKERAALLAGYNAYSKAKSIMSGGGDQRELFDAAMEHLTDDYATKMGEIDNFMDMSKGFLDTVDLENGMAETKALSQLDAWMAKSDHMIASDPPVNGTDVHLRVTSPAALPEGDEFADLLDSSASRPTKVEIPRRP